MTKRVILAALAALVLALPAYADGDTKAGEKVFKKCKACHAVGEKAKNKIGPSLNDVMGRTAGTAEGFKFSKAMIEAGEGGLVWTEESISEYLTKPRDFIAKNKMSFPGLKKEDDRINIIAYLQQYSPE